MSAQASLVVLEGANRGAVFQLLPAVNALGREPSSEVHLVDEAASRRHAEVRWDPDPQAFVLADAGSRNGTFLNGLPCLHPTPLRAGDGIRIGQTVLLVVPGDAEAASQVSRCGRSTLVVPLDALPDRAAPQPLALEAPPTLIGRSAPFRALLEDAARCAAVDANVLLVGESGTGKELVAEAIHRASARRGGPLVTVNAAVLGTSLCESELFGHERGAFTGAEARRAGCLERADGGTLFLDEVGELPPEAQAKLLRALETKRFTRLGGGQELTSDFRLIAATHRDLQAMSEAGAFRDDLRYRLDVARLEVPALRERPGDVRLLAQHFFDALKARTPSPAAALGADAFAALEAYAFPGNVRELRNMIERALIFARRAELGREDLPRELTGGPANADAPPVDRPVLPLHEVEQRELRRALAATEGNKTRAAKLLGIDRKTLYAKIERHGLEA